MANSSPTPVFPGCRSLRSEPKDGFVPSAESRPPAPDFRGTRRSLFRWRPGPSTHNVASVSPGHGHPIHHVRSDLYLRPKAARPLLIFVVHGEVYFAGGRDQARTTSLPFHLATDTRYTMSDRICTFGRKPPARS